MCFEKCKCAIFWLPFLFFYYDKATCNAITNAQFNASLRDYSVQEDNSTNTDVRTLQKEYERYASFAPITPMRFKEVPDSVLAPSSGHGRGLLHHGHQGYGLTDYEESPHYGYGYEYHLHDDQHGHDDYHGHDDHHHHLDHHYHDHHHPDHHHVDHHHHDDHKHGYGHHHKHFDHALAAKTVLWPIAGIALLGAAAALVSNPVLLQLGVVSGRRRRRDTEEYVLDKIPFKPYTVLDQENFPEKLKNKNVTGNEKRPNSKKVIDKRAMFLNRSISKTPKFLVRKGKPTATMIQTDSIDVQEHNREHEDKQFIPIPLLFRN